MMRIARKFLRKELLDYSIKTLTETPQKNAGQVEPFINLGHFFKNTLSEAAKNKLFLSRT